MNVIGLVLVTHGQLATEFIKAVEHVVGPQTQLEAVCIGPEDRLEARRHDVAAAITRADKGQGCIVLTDLFGGTPSNLSISLMQPGKIDVIAGLNLPMLVKLTRIRKDVSLSEATKQAQEAARKYINIASQILGEN